MLGKPKINNVKPWETIPFRVCKSLYQFLNSFLVFVSVYNGFFETFFRWVGGNQQNMFCNICRTCPVEPKTILKILKSILGSTGLVLHMFC